MKKLITAIIILSAFISNAQAYHIDSLRLDKIRYNGVDSGRISFAYSFAYYINNNNKDTVLEIYGDTVNIIKLFIKEYMLLQEKHNAATEILCHISMDGHVLPAQKNGFDIAVAKYLRLVNPKPKEKGRAKKIN